jgi:hypothetical protein
MEWRRRRVLVTVKAYPERSEHHGEVVCVAGVTDDGEFIRLFPVPFENFRGGKRIPKYSWIEVECASARDYLGRRESHRIRPGSTINVVDRSLTRKVDGHAPWDERKAILSPLVSKSIESLKCAFEEDRTSIGMVHVEELLSFYSTKPLGEVDRIRSAFIQQTLFGEDRTLLERLPHIFHYRFRCSPSCPSAHDMSIEDWEVFESFRSWSTKYRDPDVLWCKMYQRYFTDFAARDLYFFVGTHSRWPVWMVIGAFYPPRGNASLPIEGVSAGVDRDCHVT